MTISPEQDFRSYDTAVAALAAATGRLIATAERLTDAEVRTRSTLPGWSRGHVLTHLARNADALRNLLIWAATGVETPMYVSNEARDADIEAGSGRPASDLLADLQATCELFGNAAAGLPRDRLDEIVRMRSGREILARDVPGRRLIEVEFHHVDLDAGYTPAHWPDEFVADTLAGAATALSDDQRWPALVLAADDTGDSYAIGPLAAAGPVEVSGPQTALLAWLSGRSRGDGLRHTDPLPVLPAWG